MAKSIAKALWNLKKLSEWDKWTDQRTNGDLHKQNQIHCVKGTIYFLMKKCVYTLTDRKVSERKTSNEQILKKYEDLEKRGSKMKF